MPSCLRIPSLPTFGGIKGSLPTRLKTSRMTKFRREEALFAPGENVQKSPSSYFHFQETGFYYLQSRYYDPEICRFINADGLASTGQGFLGCNMFAYCLNNPVCLYDDGGYKPKSYDETCDDEDDDVVIFDNSDGTSGSQSQHLLGTESSNNSTRPSISSEYHRSSSSRTTLSESQEGLHRSYIRKSTRAAVEAKADRLVDGSFLDANTGTVIVGQYDLGHVYGHEYWRERNAAMADGWTQEQFNEYMNNPDFYQIEDPVFNRSHRFEMPK